MAIRPIRRVLVTNRGDVARRVFRSCRALGIETVAVYSDADASAGYVTEADLAVALGGLTPAESYLVIERLLRAASLADADAVHPGYGFLAENPEFAQSVINAGLVWIGPSPAAMRAMGSKVEARELMQQAGVPVVPGARLDPGGDLVRAAEGVGFPLLIKASAGGGGKGMRVVRDPGDLLRSVEAARREAASAFGDATVFLERYLEACRHVEIQVMADIHGTTVALFERDCSIQRRYQKIIEESPSPAVANDVRQRMTTAAVAAARKIGYVGAGTVEFLLGANGQFFFLEMNTRLQVEHPVTELVTGLDLVALQLRIAQGESLPPAAIGASITGHAIEARLYAEDPSNAFLPAIGTLLRLRIPGDVRIDSGIDDGAVITTHYDPLLAKVIAHADTRDAAAKVLARALVTAEIDGLTTNRDLLVRVLRDEDFLHGTGTTDFFERRNPAGLTAPLLDEESTRLAVAAAALSLQAERRQSARALASIPSGWRNNPSQLQRVHLAAGERRFEVAYHLNRDGSLVQLLVGDSSIDARLARCDPHKVVLETDGLRRTFKIRCYEDLVCVNSAFGQLSLRVLPRFAETEPAGVPAEGALVAPMPGAVIRVEVSAGDRVVASQPVVVLEAMKMEYELIAPGGGTVRELLVTEGQLVDAGQAVAVIDQHDAQEAA